MENQYVKEFDAWNIEQKRINEQPQATTQFYEKEVWWASLGVNIGDETDGKGDDYARPVLIVRKFSPYTLWVIPITKTPKTGSFFHLIHVNRGERTLSLLQMRSISGKRLLKKIDRISTLEFSETIQRIKDLFPS